MVTGEAGNFGITTDKEEKQVILYLTQNKHVIE
jgi:hypothetical protein